MKNPRTCALDFSLMSCASAERAERERGAQALATATPKPDIKMYFDVDYFTMNPAGSFHDVLS